MKTSTQKNLLRTALLAVLACALPALAGPDNVGIGTGVDGPLTVAVGDSGIINSYTQVTTGLAPGDTVIPVAGSAGFAAGNLVLVHQSTGIVPTPPSGGPSPIDLSADPVGRWEFARLQAVSPTALTLTPQTRLIYSYAGMVTQVIRVPEYTNVLIAAGASVTAPAWNGSTGGIVIFLATGVVQLEGDIDATGLGFRGGVYVPEPTATVNRAGCVGLDEAPPAGGQKGEGIANVRYGPTHTGRGRVSNGGAGGVCSRAGGGGGGSAGAGGQGGNTDSSIDPAPGGGGIGRAVGGQGGTALSLNLSGQVNHLLLGGGGGAGHGSTAGARTGGPGGGIIFMRAQTLAGTGSILANGRAGDPTTGLSGANGGGAGGTVYLRFASIADCDVLALGGRGGTTSAGSRFVGPGGGGGGGYVLLQYLSGTCGGNVAGAIAGQTATVPPNNDPYYGATDGAMGINIRLPGAFPLLSAPTVTTPANGSSTNNQRPTYVGTLPGTYPAGTQVIIYVDGVEVGRATPDGASWTFTQPANLPLSAGPHTVSAVAIDVANGVQSVPSNTNNFTIDITPPAAPVVVRPTNNSTTADNTPEFSGTAEVGSSTVTLTITGPGGTRVIPNVPVNGTNWSYTPPPGSELLDGQYTVTATATDAAGNVSTNSNTHTFTVDTMRPAVQVLVPAEGSTITDTTPEYSGTVEPGSTVTITVDGVPVGTATVNGNTWTFQPTVPLADGPHTVTATATDAAGNSASDSNTFNVDTMGPVAPVVSTPANGSTTNDNTPTYSGTAEPGSRVTVIVDGSPVGTTTTDPDGNWTFTPTTALPDGQHTVNATATDVLNNPSPVSNTNTFTVDTTPPAAPVVETPANGSTTDDATPTYSGTAEPGSRVAVIVDGTQVGTTTTGTDGRWTFTPTAPLPVGPHTVTATATDPAGNTSPNADTNTFTVTAGPPVVTGPANNTTTTDTTPTFTGTATPGSTVTIILNGNPVGTTTADANGNWSFTPTTPLEPGPYVLTVTATDATGTVSAPSNEVNFTVELAPEDRDFLGDGVGCASTAGEPSSALTMMGLALLAVLGARRRQR